MVAAAAPPHLFRPPRRTSSHGSHQPSSTSISTATQHLHFLSIIFFVHAPRATIIFLHSRHRFRQPWQQLHATTAEPPHLHLLRVSDHREEALTTSAARLRARPPRTTTPLHLQQIAQAPPHHHREFFFPRARQPPRHRSITTATPFQQFCAATMPEIWPPRRQPRRHEGGRGV